MKKSTLLFFMLFFFIFFIGNKVTAQTATTTINYTGFQACGGCTVCGSDYWCFNTVSSYCGNTAPCLTTNFTDPCPPGNIVTSVTVNYFSADCAGGTMTATIDGQAVPTVNEGNTGCLCSNSPCAQSATSSSNYPCGLPGYVNGGTNSLQMCTGASVCINRIVLVFTYAPANQATPAVAPSAPSGPSPVCAGTAYNYSASSSNASTYTWTVPAGWTINSGQGTGTINATPGGAGNICVTAGNLCGNSAQVCTPVTITSPPATPAAPTGSGGCSGSTQIYSTTGSAGATSYNWTVPAGSVINSGQGTTSINVTLGATSGNVCVNASNSCGTSPSACLPVTVGGTQATPAAPTGSGGCSGTTQIYSTTGSAGATSYNWTVPAGSVINSGQGTTSINVTLGASSGNVCVTATGPCGTSAAACLPVTIGGVQAPPAAPTGNGSVCNGSSNAYSTTGAAGATSYNWTVPAGAVINSGQGTSSISVTMGASSGNICVTATGPCGTSAAACTPVTIVTAPLAPTSITGTTPVCPGNENYSISAVPGATGYTWSLAGAGGSITGGQGTTAISTTWSSAVTGVVSVTADNGCGSSSVTSFTVLVNPLPNVSITPTPTAICAGATATLVASGAVNYSWLGGTVPATGGTVTVSPATTSPYTVTGTDANNCVNTAIVSITVNQTPTVSVTGAPSQTVCSGTSVAGISFSSSPAGTITWTNSNTALGGPDLSNASGSGNIGSYTAPVVGAVTTGVITANATASGTGCPSAGTSATFTLTINPLPAITGSVVTAAPCGLNTGCINSVSASGASPFQYSYDGGTSWSVSSQSCNVTNGTYPVEVQDNNGCIVNGNIVVPSQSGPAAPTVASSTATACVGDNVSLSITSPVGTYTYTWTDASGTSTGTTHTINNIGPAGNYTVSVYASDPSGCTGALTTTTITVNGAPTPPTISGSATNPLNECQGVTPQAVTVATTGTITSVPVWYNGGTYVTTGTSYSPSTAVPGTTVYTILDSATVTGCKDASAGNVLTVTVTINPGPTAPILGGSATNPLVECQGTTPAAGVTVTPTGSVVSTPVWYNGSTYVTTGTTYTPSTATSGTTVYTISDSANVTGCSSASTGNVLTVTVTINPTPTGPTLGGSATNPVIECQGGSQSIIVATTGTVTSVPVWYNGATYVTTGTSYTPSSATAGTTVYTIVDSATVGGCKNLSAGNVLTVSVTINPMPTGPVLGGSATNPLIECQNSAAQAVVVATTGTVTSLPIWYNGATYVTTGTSYTPSTATPGTTIYTIADSATVGGCVNLSAGNILTVTVTINPSPTAPIISGSATNPLIECQNAAMPATTSTTGTVTSIPVWYQGGTYVGSGTSYVPNSSTPGTTVYTVIDSATVTGCKDASAGNVLTVTVTVNPSPLANAAGLPDSSHCGQLNGGAHGVSASGGGGAPFHYQWYNGSVPIVGDTLPTLTGVGVGTYSVLITDANGCPATGGVTTFTVASAVPVVAAFTASPDSGNAPLPVVFTNASTGATTYAWNFGASTTTSVTTNAAYTYNLPGTYTVVLVASNGACADTAYGIVIVDVPTTIIIPNVFSPNGDSLNDEFFIACTGMKTLNCDIFNRWGQKVFTLTGPNQSWDGRLNNGHAANEGTYFYMLVAEGYDNKTYTYQGPLTLVK
jgi:large repetitive protein